MKHSNFSKQLYKAQVREHLAYQKQLDIALQIGLDAATIAANEILGMEADKAAEFVKCYMDTYSEICRMITEDSKDDRELTYSTAKVDERIRQIVGDQVFRPWEERYG